MKRADGYKANDGTWFATAKECKLHEEIGALSIRLAHREPYEIESALRREETIIADAIERAGAIIAAKRRESGELKRAAKKPDTADAMDKIKENMKAIS
jgi:hypothetical protein